MKETPALRIASATDTLGADLTDFTRALVACRSDSQSEGNSEFQGEATRCLDLIAEKLATIGFEGRAMDRTSALSGARGSAAG
ncbi:MAG: hypothetical protein R2835_05370 [Thermomicrobiales bacterium]